MSASIYNSTRLWSAYDSLRLATPGMATPNVTVNTTAPLIDPARATESNTVQILSVLTTFHILALVCVSLRVYTRVVVVRSPGKDDICMVLSAVCAVGGWAVFLIQAQHGLGAHQETISREDLVAFRHAGFWQSIVSATCALAFLKLSIGFNLLRLSTSKWYTWSLWATMVVVICYSIMGAMTFFFHCTSMAGNWDSSLKSKCYSMNLFVAFGLVNTSFNITTDVLFATFPVFIIWPLNMKRKLRLYLICILSLGYFAVAMGVVKAVYQTCFAGQPDKTFRSSVTFWGFLELNIGIIAACAVTLKPLLNRVLGLKSTNPYHPHNGSSRPLRHSMRQPVLINLHPHPDEIWTGPRGIDEGYSFELGNISVGKYRGGGETPSSGKISFFYEDERCNSEVAVKPPPPAIPPRSPRRVATLSPPEEGGIVRTTEFMLSAMRKGDGMWF